MSKKDPWEISEYIDSLGIELPERNNFDKLNSWLPVPNTNEEVSRDPRTSRNFERGRLLYALVAKNKPKTILEIGTAEGYSTLCMAWAMSDYNIPGKIYTIDYQSHTKPAERIHYFNKDKFKTYFCSRKQLWEKVSNPKWIDKIEIKEGYAGEVLSNTTFPKIDMAYIDGNHFYGAVRHDFFATLQITSKKFKILFDDYYSDDPENVKKVIDNDVYPNFEVTFIKTKTADNVRDLMMCLIDSDSLDRPINEIYPERKSEEIIQRYLKFERRYVIRKKLNAKIPFLKNVKFRRFHSLYKFLSGIDLKNSKQ